MLSLRAWRPGPRPAESGLADLSKPLLDLFRSRLKGVRGEGGLVERERGILSDSSKEGGHRGRFWSG